jgi:hypothetical protein
MTRRAAEAIVTPMHDTIDALLPAELRVLARFRLDVAAHLAAEAAAADPAVLAAARRPFVLKLSCPGCPPAFVTCSRAGNGAPLQLAAFSGGERPPRGGVSLTLRFTGPAACARALSGGGGTPIPIPRGPGMGAALSYFRAAAPRAAALIGDQAVPAAARARLMAVAALRGLAAVGSADPALAELLAHMPDGSVAVSAPGSFSLGVVKRGAGIAAAGAAPEPASARLSFSSPQSALAVLSGRRSAVVALGAGEVTVNGLLPLVQGMFGVLDRLGEYLAVKVKKEAAR